MRARTACPTGLDSAAMHELRRAGRGDRRRTAALPSSRWWCTAILPSRFWPTASERHASLIVLGATHRSAFENLTRDRTVYRVLAHARCPVLTLREPQAMAAEATAERVAAFHG